MLDTVQHFAVFVIWHAIAFFSDTRELRLSYDLCEEEKDFLEKRKEIILKSMLKILDEDKAPKTVDEV